jgi:hypothetical protein
MHIIGPMPTPKPYRPPSPVRATPRPAPAPPPSPRVTIHPPAESPSPRGPRGNDRTPPAFVLGKACQSLLPFRPRAVCQNTGDPIEAYTLAFAAGAFNDSIRAAKAGRHVIRLLLDHDRNKELCNTSHRCFEVWASGWDLCFTVDGSTAWGRVVLGVLGEYPQHRQLSVGATPSLEGAANADGVILYRQAELTEISLVKVGACPGTRLRFF